MGRCHCRGRQDPGAIRALAERRWITHASAHVRCRNPLKTPDVLPFGVDYEARTATAPSACAPYTRDFGADVTDAVWRQNRIPPGVERLCERCLPVGSLLLLSRGSTSPEATHAECAANSRASLELLRMPSEATYRLLLVAFDDEAGIEQAPEVVARRRRRHIGFGGERRAMPISSPSQLMVFVQLRARAGRASPQELVTVRRSQELAALAFPHHDELVPGPRGGHVEQRPLSLEQVGPFAFGHVPQ